MQVILFICGLLQNQVSPQLMVTFTTIILTKRIAIHLGLATQMVDYASLYYASW